MPSPFTLRSSITFLEEAQQQLRDMRDKFATRRDEWKRDADISETYRADRLNQLVADFSGQLDDFAARIAKANVALTQPAPPDQRPAVEQLLDEQRQARAWERAKMLLGNQTPPSRIIRAAADERDLYTLRALQQELPTWIAAHQTSGMFGVDQDDHDVATRQTLRAINLALLVTLPDGPERLALEGRLMWEAVGPIVEQELSFTRSELSTKSISGMQNAIAVHVLSSAAQPVIAARRGVLA